MRVLRRVLRTDAFIPELLGVEFQAHPLSSEDRRLVTELAYGCVRRRGTLDWVIERCAGRRVERISAGLRDILRMGVYQLLYLDRIPAYAAVHEAVELAKLHGPRGSEKFVNAVLRKAPKSAQDLRFPLRNGKPALHISLAHSHPLWLVERWIRKWGEKETEEICAASNSSPPLTVRINSIRTDRERLIEKLAAEGARAVPNPGHPSAVDIVELPGSLEALAAFRGGLFQVQDVSGMRVADLLAPQSGERIADLCAAPGGKSTAIAELMADRGEVWCMDLSAEKLRKVEENVQRLGLKSIRTVVGNVLCAEERLGTIQFDRVLVDAPCSNTGVLRRRPEVRWRLKGSDIGRLAKKQVALLTAAGAFVRRGGVLVYSTCSIEPEENDGVVKAFLSACARFTLDKEIRFFPHRSGCDGGYAVRMVSRGSGEESEQENKGRSR